ncbi:probable cytochrome P450 6a14 isoform X2 [Homalodisca vitripennis]|uniref:probable cytochrome P450 6a14 isoform X2 n=1 Tax=Homalodisca vitripennis TaxID=197043 RepID=UPI001EECD304|nr:probable cytochrome P450 6a14 isoform X2 [Homalodisca vitripennis]
MEIATVCTLALALLALILLAILIKIYSSFNYFQKRNIPYEKAKSVFGSGSGSKSLTMLLWDMYKKSGHHKLYGYFVMWRPSVLVKDLDLLKCILVKDFSVFTDHGMYYDEKADPLSGHLFALEGERWRKLRAKMSPAFTSGRMKLMFHTITRFGNKLVSYIAEKPENESIECYHLVAKYTLSNIASTAFGIESDVFAEDSLFMKMALRFNLPNFEQFLRSFLTFNFKGIVKYIPFRITPKEVSKFFLQLFRDAVKYREKNNIVRNDFLQMLINLKNNGSIEDATVDESFTLTMDQLSAQGFVFVLGGFETTALAQTWALYELALNPDIQQRLQDEVDSLDQWSYENILGLEYLDMVLKETLRKYPTVPFIIRRCDENYKVPGSDVIIEKGSDISVSVYGLHRDPELFPEPEKFDPERFGPNPSHEIKPFSYLPFGEGPRFCIGMRFAKVQAKVGIAMLMKHYTVEPTEKTAIPMVLHPLTVQPTAKDGVWLKFTRRNKL